MEKTTIRDLLLSKDREDKRLGMNLLVKHYFEEIKSKGVYISRYGTSFLTYRLIFYLQENIDDIFHMFVWSEISEYHKDFIFALRANKKITYFIRNRTVQLNKLKWKKK